MRFTIIIVLLAVFALSEAPCLCSNLLHNPPKSKWTGRKTLTWLDSGNEIRYADMYVPKLAKGKKLPVVMWFMGSRRNVRKDYHYLGLCYEDSGIEPVAKKEGFMLVVIDQKHENGRGWQMIDSDMDETLVLDVLDYLKKTFPVDHTRVYLWGISAGGKLSQVLASKHSDIFAAVINFSGVIDELGSQFDKDLTACVKAAKIKFPIQPWHHYHKRLRGVEQTLNMLSKLKYASAVDANALKYPVPIQKSHDHTVRSWLVPRAQSVR